MYYFFLGGGGWGVVLFYLAYRLSVLEKAKQIAFSPFPQTETLLTDYFHGGGGDIFWTSLSGRKALIFRSTAIREASFSHILSTCALNHNLLSGLEIDSKLSFNAHVDKIC